MNKEQKAARFTRVSVERTESVTVHLAVVDDLEKASNELLGFDGARHIHRNRYNGIVDAVADSHTGEVYAVCAANASVEDKVRTVWGIAVRASDGKSEMFNRNMLFAKLLLAAFGKEVA